MNTEKFARLFPHTDLDVDRRQTGDGHVHREVVPTGVEDARNLHLPVGDESNRGASRTELVPSEERLCLNHHRSITRGEQQEPMNSMVVKPCSYITEFMVHLHCATRTPILRPIKCVQNQWKFALVSV